MAMHVVAERRLGVPQSSGGAFTLLERAGLIEPALSKSLRGMAGFRTRHLQPIIGEGKA